MENENQSWWEKKIEERDDREMGRERKILKNKLKEKYIFIEKGSIFSIGVLHRWIMVFMTI